MGFLLDASTFKVVFKGEPMPGYTEQGAREGMAGTFLIDPITTARMRFDGTHQVLHRGKSRFLAREICRELSGAGIKCEYMRDQRVPEGGSDTAGNGTLLMTLALIAFAIFSVALLAS